MTYYKHIIILSALIITALPTRAQVINDWSTSGGGVISTTEENSIQEGDYSASGIIADWENTLRDFLAYDDEKELNKITKKEKSETPSSWNDIITKTGLQLRLPVILDENGTDLFRLTNDGITVYMTMDYPVYFQDLDEDIVKWIRYYAYHKRARTQKLFKRYAKWEQQLKSYFRSVSVPEEMTELCIIESGCTYDALSPAGALGMWQIMPETGRGVGMTINGFRDDRLDPVLSTTAAAKILKNCYNKTGDWARAAAAYNCGAGRVSGLQKKGYHTWHSIKPHLPKETQQYVPSLLAIRYVWVYRKELGF